MDACWEAIRSVSLHLGFSTIEARLGGRFFQDAGTPGGAPRWQLRVPLGETGYVQLGRSLTGLEPAEFAPFVEMLHARLLPRLVMVGGLELLPKETTAGSLLALSRQVESSQPVREQVAP